MERMEQHGRGSVMLSLIVAMAENRVIGKDNRIPWHLPADLAYFRETTMGHTVVMGRKTFESIGKPLPGRKNVVLTRNRDFEADGVTVIHSLEELMRLDDHQEEEVFVIGGAEVYALALPIAQRIYLTLIHTSVEGDSYFPRWEEKEWRLVSRRTGDRDQANPYQYEFLLFERVPKAP